MTTSETTTTEIRRYLQGLAYEIGIPPMSKQFLLTAADRLESQEATIDELEDECGKLKMTIDLLTARAEQAERERDAFIDKIRGRCSECKNEHLHSYVEPCATCHNTNGYPKWEWSGLPQDGERKSNG